MVGRITKQLMVIRMPRGPHNSILIPRKLCESELALCGQNAECGGRPKRCECEWSTMLWWSTKKMGQVVVWGVMKTEWCEEWRRGLRGGGNQIGASEKHKDSGESGLGGRCGENIEFWVVRCVMVKTHKCGLWGDNTLWVLRCEYHSEIGEVARSIQGEVKWWSEVQGWNIRVKSRGRI